MATDAPAKHATKTAPTAAQPQTPSTAAQPQTPATPATGAAPAQESSSDPWANYGELVESTKTKAGYPVLRSLAGTTVLVSNLEMDEASKSYLATVCNADGSTIGKYVVPMTYAKKIVAALKARRAGTLGVRIQTNEQKRGIGLS